MSSTLAANPALRSVAALFGLLFLFSAVYIVPYQYLLGTFVGVTFALIFILYPMVRGAEKHHVSVLDWLLAIGSLAASGYFAVNYVAMQMRAGLVPADQVFFGVLAVIVSLEAARRVIGWILPIIATLLLAYNYFAPWLSDPLWHPGFSFSRIIGKSFHGTGIYGLVASTYARYVVLFIVFGSIMQALGAGDAIIRLAQSLTKTFRAGPAKGAVLASAGIGSIVGSGVANIAITGPFTIPTIKRAGFSAERAGAIETVASVGGQLLPPVMGASAFLLAQFAGVPYRDVIATAFVPAVLYYISLYASVHFGAGAANIATPSEGGAEGRFTEFLTILRETYWTLVPIPILVAVIVYGYSAFRAAFIAVIAAIVIAAFKEPSLKRLGRKLFDGFASGTLGPTLVVASTAGVIGIVVAMLDLPGILITFTAWALSLVRGELFLAYLMIIGISLVLGMGMTVTASYVIVAVLAAPMLGELGVPLLVAHLVIFWLSQDSTVTPPFALGAFVAGGIAGGNVFRTAMIAFVYAKPLYIIPLLMIYTPLATGTWYDTLLIAVPATFGLVMIAAGFAGFFRLSTPPLLRAGLFLSGVLLLLPNMVCWAAGGTLVALIWLWQGRILTAARAVEDSSARVK